MGISKNNKCMIFAIFIVVYFAFSCVVPFTVAADDDPLIFKELTFIGLPHDELPFFLGQKLDNLAQSLFFSEYHMLLDSCFDYGEKMYWYLLPKNEYGKSTAFQKANIMTIFFGTFKGRIQGITINYKRDFSILYNTLKNNYPIRVLKKPYHHKKTNILDTILGKETKGMVQSAKFIFNKGDYSATVTINQDIESNKEIINNWIRISYVHQQLVKEQNKAEKKRQKDKKHSIK